MSEENKIFENNEENVGEQPQITAGSPEPDGEQKTAKRRGKISVPAFVLSLVAAMLAAVMVTWTFSYSLYRKSLNDAMLDRPVNNIIVDRADVEELADNIALLKAFFDYYYYYDADEEAQFDAVLKAYTEASGDTYAVYYNQEEFDALWEEAEGKSEGIGVNVINTTLTVEGYEYKVFKIINVVNGGPAEEAGLRIGDYIFFVCVEEGEYVTVDSLGYDPALVKLKGAAGTEARFTVLRDNSGGSYEEIDFTVTRRAVTTTSVMSHVCATDPSVGIVKITGFDMTTPTQFTQAVDEFVANGITKIVFDLRYNPGGDLASIVAVLSRFVDRGDTIISASDNTGYTEYITAEVINEYEGAYASCNVSKKDIGKYKDLSVAVICNEYTASAGELFVANFRDHGIGKIIGTTTYGKGSMQSIVDLGEYGFEGGLRFTTRLYFPPNGESYDGIGIVPDIVVELDEALYDKNVYEITDAEDNQLQAAIETLK